MNINEIAGLEKQIANLKLKLKRAKSNSIKVTIKPTEDLSQATVFEINHCITSYFEHLVYSYDLDKAVLVLKAPSYDIWPAIQMAVNSGKIRNKDLIFALEYLVKCIGDGPSEGCKYTLKDVYPVKGDAL